ncbi:MAG: helix-turn-helix transcriptional regulator [Turicibacter sp.]|nr:helix-turn-helix transcriptional regulator [Turicibacter sp.]
MDFVSKFVPDKIPFRYALGSINSINFPKTIRYNDRFSIIVIEKGYGHCTINNSHLALISPMVLCINETETLIITRGKDLEGKILSFHPSILNTCFDFKTVRNFNHNFSTDDMEMALKFSIFFNRNENYIGQIKASEPVLKQIQKYFSILENNNPLSYTVNNPLYSIIVYIERLVKTNSILSKSIISDASLEMHDLLLYLHNNYKDKITIPQLSKLFHINRTTLSDRFYEVTGETIITYLNKQRINMSTIMLRDSRLSISEIADEVGFNDTAYFAKLFKKYMHHTPSEYRQRYQSLLHK